MNFYSVSSWLYDLRRHEAVMAIDEVVYANYLAWWHNVRPQTPCCALIGLAWYEEKNDIQEQGDRSSVCCGFSFWFAEVHFLIASTQGAGRN